MSALTRRFLSNNSAVPFRRYQHDKIFPDDKWLTVKAIKCVQAWFGRQMARLDEKLGTLQRPEYEIKEDATLKDKIMIELKPDMLKYRIMWALCFARCKLQSVSGDGFEKAPQKIKPIRIQLNVAVQLPAEKMKTDPENGNFQIVETKQNSTPPKNLN